MFSLLGIKANKAERGEKGPDPFFAIMDDGSWLFHRDMFKSDLAAAH